MGNPRGRTVWRVLCAAGLAVALGAAGAASVDAEGRIVLTAEEKAACASGGGCVVLTMQQARYLLELAERGEKMRCGANWKGMATWQRPTH